MSLLNASTRFGLFAVLLGVIVLSLFGGLLAANRALVSADREATELDAHTAALIIERDLRLKAEALTHLSGVLPNAQRERRTQAVDRVGLPNASFNAVWVVDTSGRIIWRRISDTTLPLDTAAVAAAARDAKPASWPGGPAAQITRHVSGTGILLTVPFSRDGQRSGAAVGYVSGRNLLSTLRDTAVARPSIALRAGGRPVAMEGNATRSGSYLSATAPVQLPGQQLEIEVTHAQSGRTLRTAFWAMGLAAFVMLLAVLARERKQAMQLAGRTTELERLYQEVARSNRMKSEFLANVSHELRTPLNAVVGFVEMLREGVYGELSPRQTLPVDRIAASATHLRHLVDRLLDIAKIAAGRLEIHPEPLVLRPFVLNVASEMESLVAERGLALSIGVGPSLPRIRTDQTHLRQILINLIGNAVKYTPSGSIQVRARVIGDGAHAAPVEDGEAIISSPPDPRRNWVALQVSDTGVGIASSDLERIFDEFEQVNAGARTDSARRGTGLGLAISRRLARLLGGDLTVTSEVGRGSVFTVWLPLETGDKKSD